MNDTYGNFYYWVWPFLGDLFKIAGEDEAFFHKYLDGVLLGQVAIHVDNLIMARSDRFIEEMLKLIELQLTILKVERTKFRFTGIDREEGARYPCEHVSIRRFNTAYICLEKGS